MFHRTAFVGGVMLSCYFDLSGKTAKFYTNQKPVYCWNDSFNNNNVTCIYSNYGYSIFKP